ncbi:rRNA maturation RNase YbeY [candidate division WWE3 bacterium CG06_land_8_20_14_3_00_42_16]|uniref:Endoribonuclease YbeY n=4 Tax=Katanobacteria TaxID=422282 RepID=A0A2M7ALF2_UNCKA|nr:MAG: rRNA maturation RNase YbeY [bacterium CG1_02_42_9]PIU68195.1 MAG: rRNA maturation RNase YbeY [candidate division WWE3 bacterium CG06_land_8_20_14_3_00_42_16]PIZ43643.1 MAG: rRNA maturation RNase YbeY [candidate division WWE3 bacterium CG_4_10_14_0_2_um_filter_42_8]PJA38497.1 MAG: rRNA maturation RNase YbeY [candidate division WWE3 bacterium CG_4_9_14_3_um_filter_43_9]PJC68386.1 MAG: rRNA maturation RNase YbeY [candidate division WWE3 bacterium CG_4_8_14_3_um_filter_42_11]
MIPKDTKKINLSFAVFNDRKMKSLNQQYFKRKNPTDVIAFNLNEKVDPQTYLLGELVISYPQLKRQAKKYQVSVAEELARVVAHGVLHLMGYGDETVRQRKDMTIIEDQVIERLKKDPDGTIKKLP